MNPDLRTIAEQELKERGYDGLFSPLNCSCLVEDLMPCDEPSPDCEAGYRVPCPGPEECEAGGCDRDHIAREKPSIENSKS